MAEGNGHDGNISLEEEVVRDAAEEAFTGARVNLAELKRDDGILTRSQVNTGSLLHRAISAIKGNTDYRDELKVASFVNSDEADEATAAINERITLKLDLTPIVDRIIARSAGRNHELLFKALETLTHSTFTTNYQKDKHGKPKSSSPIS